MTDTNGELMDIGTVAAHNIVAAVGLGEEHVQTVRNAIRDEINAMGSHFSIAMRDVQDDYEVQLKKIKSDFVWLQANKAKVAGVIAAVFAVGAVVGHFV